MNANTASLSASTSETATSIEETTSSIQSVARTSQEMAMLATQVTTSRTRKSGQPAVVRERQDVTQRAEVLNDAEIVQQMYWVGILNTNPHFVPLVKCYELNDNDLKQMRLPEINPAFLNSIGFASMHSARCRCASAPVPICSSTLASTRPAS